MHQPKEHRGNKFDNKSKILVDESRKTINFSSSFPEITHLCPEKWIVDEETFEKPAKFKTPCVFFTGILKKDNALLVSYGAADEHAAIMEIDFDKV